MDKTMTILKNKFATFFLAAAALLAFSCDDNDEIKVDPNAEFDAVLEVNEAGPANPNKDVAVDANTASTIKAKVAFTSTTKSMKRLYITQNIKGEGEQVYEPSENIDLKGDGSVDLTGKDDKGFEFQFTLPVPAGVGTGTVVYKFWTTDGSGDFRDMTKRLAVGPGTITLKYGTATNPAAGAAPVKAYSAKILAAPLNDGSSLTFISLIGGDIYKISDGAEYARLWDFGYYYTNAAGASLASAFNYEASFPFVNVDAIAGTTELNKAYFTLSTKTSANFDAVTTAEHLSFITTPANQNISGLTAGKIVEFVDNYGKKGLIRVTEVKGTFNSGDYIKIDVKVQP
jgi:hypothetical protein